MLKHTKAQDSWTEKSLGEKGFTLIELLVVIIILGILAAVAIFAIGGINDNAKESACKTEVSTVETAVAAYAAQNDGEYPGTVSQMIGGAEGNLKKTPKYVADSIASGGVLSLKSSPPGDCSDAL